MENGINKTLSTDLVVIFRSLYKEKLLRNSFELFYIFAVEEIDKNRKKGIMGG